MALKLTPQKWVVDAMAFIPRKIYYGIGSGISSAARALFDISAHVTKNIPIPSEETSAADSIKRFYDDIWRGVPEEQRNDLFLNLISLVGSLLMLGKIPMTLSALIQDKEIVQKFRERVHPSLLDSNTVVQAWLRNIKDAADGGKLWGDISKTGFSDDQIEVMKKVALFMPSAPDLIYFGRRDIFNPQTVSFFQYDQAVPAIPPDMLRAAGLDEEKFKLFWMAHWRDIEFRTASVMLHRGVIDDGEFTMMLKAANYAPGIIDKLKKISHNVFTRVDVRRMHKLGIVTEDDLVKSYMDLGYDREHAGKMKDFTVAYNADPESTETTAGDVEIQKERDLTKADILRMYSEGLMKEEDAAEGLKLLGYSEDESGYYFSRIEYQKEQDKTRAYLDLYHRGYITGVYDEAQVRSFFGQLDFPDKYQEHLLEMWDIEMIVKTSTPSKAELVRFFKKGIITETDLRQELAHKKYEEKYINWYLKDLGTEIPEEK